MTCVADLEAKGTFASAMQCMPCDQAFVTQATFVVLLQSFIADVACRLRCE